MIIRKINRWIRNWRLAKNTARTMRIQLNKGGNRFTLIEYEHGWEFKCTYVKPRKGFAFPNIT